MTSHPLAAKYNSVTRMENFDLDLRRSDSRLASCAPSRPFLLELEVGQLRISALNGTLLAYDAPG